MAAEENPTLYIEGLIKKWVKPRIRNLYGFGTLYPLEIKEVTLEMKMDFEYYLMVKEEMVKLEDIMPKSLNHGKIRKASQDNIQGNGLRVRDDTGVEGITGGLGSTLAIPPECTVLRDVSPLASLFLGSAYKPRSYVLYVLSILPLNFVPKLRPGGVCFVTRKYSRKQTQQQKITTSKGYIFLLKKQRPTTVRNEIFQTKGKEYLDRIHTEMSRKCMMANFRYCTKERNSWVWDLTSKYEGKKNKKTDKKYQKCVELAKEVTLLNAYYRTLQVYTGITYKELSVYYKNKNKWWDKYKNEEIVIIEEATPDALSKKKGKSPEQNDTPISNNTITNDNNSDFCPTPTYTILTINKFTYTDTDFHCIKCKTKTFGLFCTECSKIQQTKNNQAMCNECGRYFSALIDGHCPECTQKLKNNYNTKKTKI
ncbi:hypothetical protein PIROE2DRAFT_10399 [Piromyces sp. E2]|nr:hypothetical protein PIROE2DRAFT_10399 [Piromyces sp. E2]|eukprot:OUM63135.1 hypothetical protein PIROE2DRAFT_10399 [Piromyces sp. E2]